MKVQGVVKMLCRRGHLTSIAHPPFGSFQRRFVCGGLSRARFPVAGKKSGFPVGNLGFPLLKFSLGNRFPLGDGFPRQHLELSRPPGPHAARSPKLEWSSVT